MYWADAVLVAGSSITIAGFVLTLFQAKQKARERARGASARRLESIGEIASLATTLGGVALVLFADAAKHLSERTLPPNPWLALDAGVALVLVFGIHLGRLHMRWQLRRLRIVLDTEDGNVTTRS